MPGILSMPPSKVPRTCAKGAALLLHMLGAGEFAFTWSDRDPSSCGPFPFIQLQYTWRFHAWSLKQMVPEGWASHMREAAMS